MADTSLLQALVDRAVQERLQPLQHQLWAHHWALTELVRQLPRPAVLATAQRLDQMFQLLPDEQKEPLRETRDEWHQYLCQLGALVEGDMPPGFASGQPVPERLKLPL